MSRYLKLLGFLSFILSLISLSVSPSIAASSCDRVTYPDWIKNINTEKDLEQKLLVPDTGTSTKVDAIDNPNFGENDTDNPEITTDTMVQRCNTTFGDTGNPAYEHWVFCRAFRLPTGDTYSNMTELKNSADSASPDNLVTLTFFHAGNIDDKSEDWLFPFIKKYRNRCMKRPVNVIWMGAFVKNDTSGRQIFEGNKWHITGNKWGTNNTALFDVTTQSSQVYSGHSAASCPDPGNDVPSTKHDTRGIYVGGSNEDRARRVNARFRADTGLYVGTGSDSQGQCFSGVTDGNPVTASGGGVQFEYNVGLGDPDESLTPADIANTVIPELTTEYATDTPPVSTSVSIKQDTVTVSTDIKNDCVSDSTRFFTASTDTTLPRVTNYTDSRSSPLIDGAFDTSMLSLEIETDRKVDTSCLTLSLDLSDWSDTVNFDTSTPILFDESTNKWKEISEFNGATVLSDTLPIIEFRPPHFSTFAVAGGVTNSSNSSSDISGSSCLVETIAPNNELTEHVRTIRDKALQSAPGRVFTTWYYTIYSR